jgi:hypothetical protein
MKLSNPFASVRNFIRSSEPGTIYTSYAPTYVPTYEQSKTSSHDSHNLFLPMQDKSLLLRPLSDTHLIEVYYEAIAMRLSEEFISLIKHAIQQRGLSTNDNVAPIAQ